MGCKKSRRMRYEQVTMDKPAHQLIGLWSVKAEKQIGHQFKAWLDAALRRLLDIVLSLGGLIALSPVFLMISVAIKRDSPGPVFYKGARVGKNGKIFQIYKFRTMHETPQAYNGAKVTAADDDRITTTGKWLRESKLNELPQFWNVLKGDMSLVGPRPEDPDLIVEWPEEVRQQLLAVRPGLTSPASIVYRNEETLLKAASLMDDYLLEILPTKLRLDLVYLRNRSILTDLDIIFWTMVAVFPSIGDYVIPQNLLYWGPLAIFFSRYLSWFALDSLMAFLVVAVVGLVWRLQGPLELGLDLALLVSLVISLVFSLFNAILGLNQIHWSRARIINVMPLAASSVLSTAALILVNTNIGSQYPLPRLMILTIGAVCYVGFVAMRYRERLLVELAALWARSRSQHRTFGERVLIVGTGENSALASWLFARKDLAQIFSVIGMVDDDPRKQGMVIDGHKVLGNMRELPALIKKQDVGLVVLALEDHSNDQQTEILRICNHASVRVIFLSDAMQAVRLQLQTFDFSNRRASKPNIANEKSIEGLLDEMDALTEQNDREKLHQRIDELRRKIRQ